MRCNLAKAISFGPFRLIGAERRLERDGVHVRLGGRALEILIALVERAEDVVSKRDLVARVWPRLTVDESCLRFHVRTLRKALGDDGANARYIATVTGRGYSFVGSLTDEAAAEANVQPMPGDSVSQLPPRLPRMVGRDDAVHEISQQLREQRFVSIVGPGGIGKTTAAVAVAHMLDSEFGGAVHFVDFGQLRDFQHVQTAVAATFGLYAESEGTATSLLSHLRGRRALLVLDCCEHVIDAVALLAELIVQEAPDVHVLATSRESLRVEGEHVHRLLPLGYPPEGAGLKAAEALAFPAVQLFVERMRANDLARDFDDGDAPVVAEICRRLDGIALALELAAGRVDAYGIRGIADLLDTQFNLLWRGRRTAIPRHQTLSATLDWSYSLLPEAERVILRRLSVFVGPFSLDAAEFVAADDNVTAEHIRTAVENLVAKSLALANTSNGTARYRLLDTTRAYLIRVLADCGEVHATARRHALYVSETVRRIDSAECAGRIENVRAALEWSFSTHGDAEIGIELASGSAATLLERSLLTECRTWTERALTAEGFEGGNPQRKLTILKAFAISSMFTLGNTAEALLSLKRGLGIADELRDGPNQLRILGLLSIFYTRLGNFGEAFSVCLRCSAIADARADPIGKLISSWLLGASYHFRGDQLAALSHLEKACYTPPDRQIHLLRFDDDHRIRACVVLARTLWLRGRSGQAIEKAREAIAQANSLGHAATLCMAQILAVPIFLWAGDHLDAESAIDQCLARAAKHRMAPYRAISIGFRGSVAVRNGETEAGIRFLSESLKYLAGLGHNVLVPTFTAALAEGQAATGRYDEAISTINAAIKRDERHGGSFYTPEIWRVKAQILLATPDALCGDAEKCFVRSLDWSRRQSALIWELRAATGLADLWRNRGRHSDAQCILASVYIRFSDGLNVPDLQRAKHLLNIMSENGLERRETLLRGTMSSGQ